MADAQRPELRGAPADDPVPDGVALDQSFRTGDLYSLRAAVSAHASALGGKQEQVETLVIVASELATNAIVHGGGAGRLQLWSLDGQLLLRVTDRGPGIADPNRAGRTAREPSALGGRGLWIARQLCDEVDIASGPSGSAVTVTVHLPAAA
jgi:anti-sigma regulatory factor (Ser/Thr protein kinase)